jgi:hypothetical protein
VTKDVIALTPKMPDTRTLIAGLFAGGPDLGLTSTEDGAVLQLHTRAGRPLVSVEAPRTMRSVRESARTYPAQLQSVQWIYCFVPDWESAAITPNCARWVPRQRVGGHADHGPRQLATADWVSPESLKEAVPLVCRASGPVC